MKILKTILVLLILSLPAISQAQDSDGVAVIENLTAIPENSGVGEYTTYTLNFDINAISHSNLKNGALVVSFPADFDISSADDIMLSNNSSEPFYRVTKVDISGTNLTLHLGAHLNSTGETDPLSLSGESFSSITIMIDNIGNPSLTNDYLISMIALKQNNKILYGPAVSEPFSITAGSLATIEVSPSDDLSLEIGELVDFSAVGFDQLGNQLENLEYIWSVDFNQDMIGTFTGSRFEATTVGTGQIMAEAEGVVGYSGQIVVHGKPIPLLFYVENSLSPLTVSAGGDNVFSFKMTNNSLIDYEFLPALSRFTLSEGGTSYSVDFDPSLTAFNPGENEIMTNRIYIPEPISGSFLNASAVIALKITGSDDIYYLNIDFADMLEVISTPLVQIVSLETFAPNSPCVNIGQAFEVVALVTNLSDRKVNDVTLNLYSDGPFDFVNQFTINEIESAQTAQVSFEITGTAITETAGVFQLSVTSANVKEAAPLDNITLVVVDSPADIEMIYTLIGAENNVINYGNNFDIDVAISNLGTAKASPAEYRIIVSGLDLNGPDTMIAQFPINNHFDFSYVAPTFDTLVMVDFELITFPIDLNTGLTAKINETSFHYEIAVVSADADLTIEREVLGNNLILPGRVKDVFEITLTNNALTTVSSIELQSIEVLFETDSQSSMSLIDLINSINTGFYENGFNLTQALITDSSLIFDFDGYIISPNDSKSIIFGLELTENFRGDLKLELLRKSVKATYFNGPKAGLPVIVTSPYSSTILISEQLVLKSENLQGSFLMSDNPFNPFEGPVSLTFELSQESDTEFRVFTITGETVYSETFYAGNNGAQTGENIISWDGRNNNNEYVLNGIYIAFIKNKTTGEDARIKMAVIK